MSIHFHHPEPKTKDEKQAVIDGVMGRKRLKHKISRLVVTPQANGHLMIEHTPVGADKDAPAETLPPNEAHVRILKLLGTGEASNDLKIPGLGIPE